MRLDTSLPRSMAAEEGCPLSRGWEKRIAAKTAAAGTHLSLEAPTCIGHIAVSLLTDMHSIGTHLTARPGVDCVTRPPAKPRPLCVRTYQLLHIVAYPHFSPNAWRRCRWNGHGQRAGGAAAGSGGAVHPRHERQHGLLLRLLRL